MKLIINNISDSEAEEVLYYLNKGKDKIKQHLQNKGKNPSTDQQIKNRIKNKNKKP